MPALLDDHVARLLSNGSYATLVTGAGSGFSMWGDYDLTGWSADPTESGGGLFIYLRDLDGSALWSAGHQPVRHTADGYEVRRDPGRFTIDRRDGDIDSRLEVCVALDADVELRRLTLTNRSDRARRIEVTSYAEVVLNLPAAHAAHPAFSKLFVQTEHVAEHGALAARRRPRSHGEPALWMACALTGGGPLQWETDRARFLGRGYSRALPRALAEPAPLSGTTGSVLDPVFVLRRVVSLDPGVPAQLCLLLAAAAERQPLLGLLSRYASSDAVEAAFRGAAAAERALMQRLGVSDGEAEQLEALAGAVLCGNPSVRAGAGAIEAGRSMAELSRYGVSGAWPLVLVEAAGANAEASVRDASRMRDYWRAKGFEVDLLVVCDDLPASIATSPPVYRRSDIPPADLNLIRACARAILPREGENQSREGEAPAERFLSFQERRSEVVRSLSSHHETPPADATAAAWRRAERAAAHREVRPPDIGSFSDDGTEYIIRIDAESRPPMPWTNVVANETFGFLVSESGAGCTWSRNSRENRLTPWYNDPILDSHGEALYLRDEDAGVFWSPLPGPSPDGGSYEVRHGFGYTRWRHASGNLEQEVCMFVPRRDPVKITRVRLRNTADQSRRLSMLSYSRLVLGVLPEESGRFVVTGIDSETGAVFARNSLNNEFSDGVVFAAAAAPDGTPVRCSADRTSFIGRGGDPSSPAALRFASVLDARVGDRLDPCAALQVELQIPPRGEVECVFLLGEATSEAQARDVIRRHLEATASDPLEEVRAFWRDTLTAVQVQTPMPGIDVMANGWLLYQDLSCRIWGRSAFYQSGGAFGFRDQLQDSTALIYTRADLTRAQILLHAAHQFVEGDVLHWWHPPTGRGIRTRFSDDLLWLPYLTAFYVHTTGDASILDEAAGFVNARVLQPGEDEVYLLPAVSDERADVYEHCCRAVDRSLTRGAHGLPLMGTGDWNDGMNRVGREGRGESVWMGFFLYRTIDCFAPLCERRGDAERARRYRAYQAELKRALEEAGWDGAWYRRAYYDDGAPLGSAQNEECRIDLLAQAWAVISRAAAPERAARAMDAVERMLVDEKAGLIRLLAPPFDCDTHDPGYIKGYVPGIRENGGQYTHAAVWAVRAMAQIGRRERAAALLEMLGPVHHGRDADAVAAYQVEPYVVAADIYGIAPHLGRGGWTWYTGSAGWMYRVALESILGFHLEGGDTLRLEPHIPDHWPGYQISYRRPDGKTRYEIEVRNPNGNAAAVRSVTVDGSPVAEARLVDDGAVHQIIVELGCGDVPCGQGKEK